MRAGPALQAPLRPLPCPGALRVTGALREDAHLASTTGHPRHVLLCVHLQVPEGLPYTARIDLGADPADHSDAEAMLPKLRRGAVLTVAAEALQLRTEHGQHVLHLHQAHSALLLERAPEPAAPEPDLFALTATTEA
jgi:hypothetical protein